MSGDALTGTISGLALVAAAAILVRTGIRALSGELPLRNWSGIRTRATMASDEAWKTAHLAGGSLLWWAGVTAFTAGGFGTMLALYGSGPGLVFGLILGGAVVTAGLTVLAAVIGHRAAAEIE